MAFIKPTSHWNISAKPEYCKRTFSRWYPEENLRQLNNSLDKAQTYKPDLVIPGHDRAFTPNK